MTKFQSCVPTQLLLSFCFTSQQVWLSHKVLSAADSAARIKRDFMYDAIKVLRDNMIVRLDSWVTMKMLVTKMIMVCSDSAKVPRDNIALSTSFRVASNC